MKWLITAAREQQKNKNKNARMYKKLAKELIDAYNNEVRKRLVWIMSNACKRQELKVICPQ